jgi:hypothetical protein
MATTGLVGCALGLAVVWLLVPGGLDQQPVAGPTVSRSVGAAGVATATTDQPVGLLNPTTVVARPSTTLAATAAPTHTVAVRTSGSAAPATAVLIEGTSLLLTTATAVREQRRVSVEDASDNVHETSVVGASGDLVVLAAASADVPVDAVGFDSIGRADEGDAVVVLGATPIQIAYPAAGAAIELARLGDAGTIAEGTPVVDAEGVLVALCTHDRTDDGATEVRVVPIADVLASLLGEAPTDTSVPDSDRIDDGTAGSGWIGVRLVDRVGPDAVVVDWVAPASPAEVAGVAAGEVIVAIDGTAVSTVDELRALLARSSPGNTVVLTLLAADGGERNVSVVLGVAVPDL